MKDDFKKYAAKLAPAVKFIRQYLAATVILIILAIFGFLVWRIGSLANAEPTSSAVDEALVTVKRPRIDPNAISALQDLQGHNVDIQSLFPTSRNNPFQE
jgi:predicted negative regulator of RcsB-dependent stress response